MFEFTKKRKAKDQFFTFNAFSQGRPTMNTVEAPAYRRSKDNHHTDKKPAGSNFCNINFWDLQVHTEKLWGLIGNSLNKIKEKKRKQRKFNKYTEKATVFISKIKKMKMEMITKSWHSKNKKARESWKKDILFYNGKTVLPFSLDHI